MTKTIRQTKNTLDTDKLCTKPSISDTGAKDTLNGNRQTHNLVDEFLKVIRHNHDAVQFIERANISLDEAYQRTVNEITAGMRHSDIACARISIDGKEFITKNFTETKSHWKKHLKK